MLCNPHCNLFHQIYPKMVHDGPKVLPSRFGSDQENQNHGKYIHFQKRPLIDWSSPKLPPNLPPITHKCYFLNQIVSKQCRKSVTIIHE